MTRGLEELFQGYRRTGDPELLGEIFDRTAPSLMRVALHLAANSAQAEDALQSTFLTAIERGKVWDPSRPLLPWLQGILGKHLQKARSDDARKPRRDRIRKETTVDAAGEAERREAIAVLRNHVDRLSENHRQVLLLHLEHGLEPIEIGEVLDLAPSAVRMRLMRAREELKRLLPGGIAPGLFGLRIDCPDLAGLRARILERASLPTPVLLTAGAALLMKKILTSVAAVGLLALLATTWIGLDPLGNPAGSPEEMPLFEPVSVHGNLPSTEVSNDERHVIAESTADKTWPEPETGSLEITVINADGKPLPMVGLMVLPQHGAAREMGLLSGATDQGGVAKFESLATGAAEVFSDRWVNRVAQIVAGEVTEIEIQVPQGKTVFGRVVDQEGASVAHADLWVRLNTARQVTIRVGTANEEGRFQIDHLAPLGAFIGASKKGYAPSTMVRVYHPRSDEQNMVITLQGTGARVRGLVLDEKGRPITGALIRIGGRFGGPEPIRIEGMPWGKGWATRRVLSDEQGTFYADGLAPGQIEFLVHARGQAPYSRFIELSPDAANEVTIRMAEGATLRGRIFNPSGDPVSTATIEVEGYGHQQVTRGRSDSLGRFRFDGLDPRRMKLTVTAVRYARHVQELRSEAGLLREVDVQLAPAGSIKGQVVDPEGQPLSGWLILTEFNRDRNPANEQGLFAIMIGGLEKTRLWVAAPDVKSAILCDWLGEVPANGKDLLIQIPAGLMPSASIRGRVIDAEGEARRGVSFNLNQNGYWVTSSGVDSETGRFSLGPLAAGTYELRSWINDSEIPPFHLGNITVAAGQDLDLGAIGSSPRVGNMSGLLELQVQRVDDILIEQHHIYLYDGSGGELGWLLMDENGHTRQSLIAGDYLLSVHPDNAQWLRRKFTIVAEQETKIDLMLRPAARRYLTFPIPIPMDWQNVQRIDYLIRHISGDVILEDSLTRDEIPVTTMPGFEIGLHRLELRTDDGRLYIGEFAVESLNKSQVPIVIAVEKRSHR